MTPLFDRMAIIGIGLIGSSLARAVRAEGLARVLTCADASAENAARALHLGIVDEAGTDVPEAVRDADLVMLCVPVGAYAAVAETMAPALKPGAIVSDVGSVKQAAIDAIRPHLPDGVHLVPGHPVAGTEKSGPEAGFAALFRDRWCVLTPLPDADERANRAVADLWRGCGMMVERMPADHHDRVLAITSHLPHLIAYTIVGTATDLEDHLRQEVIKYSASGFRDFTRIAASDPVMWRDVFLNNKDAVLDCLQRFNEDLTALQRAIRRGEGDALMDLFTRTRDIRRGVLDARQA